VALIDSLLGLKVSAVSGGTGAICGGIRRFEIEMIEIHRFQK
jgi:hypothetical protein